MKSKVLVCGLAWMMVQGAANVAAESLQYEPTIVQLSGALVIEDHYGPPNFGENPETDRKEQVLILTLDTPIDVVGSPTGTINTTSFAGVRRVQLVGRQAMKLTVKLGRHAVVRGTLFQRQSAEHHTDVLINVQSVTSNSPE
jgi:hypothetical protein